MVKADRLETKPTADRQVFCYGRYENLPRSGQAPDSGTYVEGNPGQAVRSKIPALAGMEPGSDLNSQ
jgi:hypothetical protein